MGNIEELKEQFKIEQDDYLTISLELIDGLDDGILLSLVGSLDTYNTNYFRNKIKLVQSYNFNKLIFQCAELNHISSTGIGSFSSFLKIVKSNNGDIVLVNILPEIISVFSLVGFDQFFTFKDSVADAIAYFKEV